MMRCRTNSCAGLILISYHTKFTSVPSYFYACYCGCIDKKSFWRREEEKEKILGKTFPTLKASCTKPFQFKCLKHYLFRRLSTKLCTPNFPGANSHERLSTSCSKHSVRIYTTLQDVKCQMKCLGQYLSRELLTKLYSSNIPTTIWWKRSSSSLCSSGVGTCNSAGLQQNRFNFVSTLLIFCLLLTNC